MVREADCGSGAAGYARRAKGDFSITINKNFDLNEKYSTLVHELGHIYAGHVGKREESWWPDRSSGEETIQEPEAESISFLVCRRRGLETSSEQFLSEYVSQHGETPPISFETVITVAGQIELMGERLTRPPRKGTKKPS